YRWTPDGRMQETVRAGWTVGETYATVGSRRAVVRLTIRPTRVDRVPPGGITARLLRTIPIGRIAPTLRADLAHFYGHTLATAMATRYGATVRPTVVRRQRHGDAFYAAIALGYVKLRQAGERAPTTLLAKAWHVPVAKMSSWVNLARRNGFL